MIDLNKFFETFWPGLVVALIMAIPSYIKRKTIFLWFKRFKLKFFPVKFNVGLSINTNEGVNSGKYFYEINREIIFTNGFIKKSTKTPRNEINKSKEIRKYFKENKP